MWGSILWLKDQITSYPRTLLNLVCWLTVGLQNAEVIGNMKPQSFGQICTQSIWGYICTSPCWLAVSTFPLRRQIRRPQHWCFARVKSHYFQIMERSHHIEVKMALPGVRIYFQMLASSKQLLYVITMMVFLCILFCIEVTPYMDSTFNKWDVLSLGFRQLLYLRGILKWRKNLI